MSLRIRALQWGLSAWALMLVADAVMIFVDRDAALARWHRLQTGAAAGSEALSGTPIRLEITGVAALGIDMYAAAVLTFAIVALVLSLVWRAHHRPEARVLAVFLAFLMAPGQLVERLGIPMPLYLVLTSGIGFVTLAAFLRFAALFPRPLAPQDLGSRRRWVRGLQESALSPGRVWGAAAVMGTLTVIVSAVALPVGGILGGILIVPLVVGLSLLRRSFAVTSAHERRKLLWVVQGFYTGAWILALGVVSMLVLSARAGFVSAMAGEPATLGLAFLVFNLGVELAMLVLLVSLATAIFYHGAVEPGLVIRGTTLYGVLTVVGAGTFGLVENLASDIVLQALGLPESWGGAVAGAAVAAGVALLRPRVARWISSRSAEAGARGVGAVGHA